MYLAIWLTSGLGTAFENRFRTFHGMLYAAAAGIFADCRRHGGGSSRTHKFHIGGDVMVGLSGHFAADREECV
jgi:hypothetical protein